MFVSFNLNEASAIKDKLNNQKLKKPWTIVLNNQVMGVSNVWQAI